MQGSRATLLLLLIALLAGGTLLLLQAREGGTPPQDDLLGDLEDEPRGDAPEDDAPAVQPTGDDAPVGGGVPRILPPDAAIEDVRDALAIQEASGRRDALGEAYAAIGRIAQAERILVGLQRHVLSVADARVRGVTHAALGANASGTSHAWLVARLREDRDDLGRLGALLGLAYAAEAAPRAAPSLGELPYRARVLPARVDVRDALASWLGTLEGAAARDALPVLRASLAAHDGWFDPLKPAVTALEQRLGE